MGMGGWRDGPAPLHSRGQKPGVIGAVCAGSESLSTRFNPRNLQLVSSSYTAWANTANKGDRYLNERQQMGETVYKEVLINGKMQLRKGDQN